MKDYLDHAFDRNDPALISVIDELSLWAAPFGLKLLEKVILNPRMNVLDIGCGLGFPSIELAQRLGISSRVYSLDPWERALERLSEKLKYYGITNVEIVKGMAEKMPFEDNYFDLLVSNNGINNVKDLDLSLSECSRVCRPGAQFVMTINLKETMVELYDILERILRINHLTDEIEKMHAQIHAKRKPLNEMTSKLEEAGFSIQNVDQDGFHMDFLDGAAMFRHHLIKYWFLDGWKSIVEAKDMESVFDQVEAELDGIAAAKGKVRLTIPFVTLDLRKA